ncbi:MAG: hypothetical protein JWN40_1609 [Phycisphaerales bacterium]|nr:hypothetical protein [Phycisphaerales bacterium]
MTKGGRYQCSVKEQGAQISKTGEEEADLRAPSQPAATGMLTPARLRFARLIHRAAGVSMAPDKTCRLWQWFDCDAFVEDLGAGVVALEGDRAVV